MQYLVKTTTHDTGEVFHDVIKARENEVFTLVDAESEDEAKLLAEGKRITEIISTLNYFNRKDSE